MFGKRKQEPIIKAQVNAKLEEEHRQALLLEEETRKREWSETGARLGTRYATAKRQVIDCEKRIMGSVTGQDADGWVKAAEYWRARVHECLNDDALTGAYAYRAFVAEAKRQEAPE